MQFLLSSGKRGNIDENSSGILQSIPEQTIYVPVETIFQALSLCAAVPGIHVLHVIAEQKLNQADHEMAVSGHRCPQLFVMFPQLGTSLQSGGFQTLVPSYKLCASLGCKKGERIKDGDIGCTM